MPTNTNAYNSRVTDEALEKRFRDTFRSQGGAELVDDLYAQGVIVPVVDFTAAATGQQLVENLQTAWDFSTGSQQIVNTTTDLITNAGFWRVQGSVATSDLDGGSVALTSSLQITDGVSTKRVFGTGIAASSPESNQGSTITFDFVVFLRSGDTFQAFSAGNRTVVEVAYRQIATVSGDLVNPSGFTSS